MNRRLIVSILAIILVISMLAGIVLAALPANAFGCSVLAIGDNCAAVLPVMTVPAA
ncbi:MAG: hypothetical protein HUJ66_03540 [Oscillospiraceae bacterium]|nr:hypothetical protein [Oscillospiraceae bacterium]